MAILLWLSFSFQIRHCDSSRDTGSPVCLPALAHLYVCQLWFTCMSASSGSSVCLPALAHSVGKRAACASADSGSLHSYLCSMNSYSGSLECNSDLLECDTVLLRLTALQYTYVCSTDYKDGKFFAQNNLRICQYIWLYLLSTFIKYTNFNRNK